MATFYAVNRERGGGVRQWAAILNSNPPPTPTPTSLAGAGRGATGFIVRYIHHPIFAFIHRMLFFSKGRHPKKKLADLRTLSQLSLPLPPLGPIRTNLNWDIFEDRYPPPPLLQLGQNAFEFFEFKFRSLYAKTVIED